MANDNMRTGPRGSSKQKAEFGIETIWLQFDSAASTTFTVPLPFDTACAVVGCEAFALTNVLVKATDNATLALGRTGGAAVYATFAHTAKTGGDFLVKTDGASAADPFVASELIKVGVDLTLTYVASAGANANAGAVVVRVTLQAVSGGLFSN